MALIDPSIFKAYDIRGIYPSQINEDDVYIIVQSIIKFLQQENKNSSSQQANHLTLAVGRDMRLSSPPLFDQAIKAICDAGCDVVDVGLVSTPTFYFAVYHYGFDAGIQISASHNPKEYNGIKIVKKTDKGLIKIGKPTGMDQIRELALNFSPIKSEKGGHVTTKQGVVLEEVKTAFAMLGNPRVGSLKVVADPANAMGSLYLEALFSHLPCRLIKMNFDLDGNFPAHQPDPLQKETLIDLQKRVVVEKAALGIAPDGDGDRVFFIDEKGEVIPASVITALVARELLAANKGEKIAFDIRYTWTPQKAIREAGGVPIITRVGHAFITEVMNKEDCLFAGESSGHYFFRQNGYAEFQVPVILIVLSILSRENKPLSQVLAPLYASFESGEHNFHLESQEQAQQSIDSFKRRYGDGKISELDGLAVEYADWRFNLRSSNTEPLLRINVEAKTRELMEQKRDELITLLKK